MSLPSPRLRLRQRAAGAAGQAQGRAVPDVAAGLNITVNGASTPRGFAVKRRACAFTSLIVPAT